MSMTPQQEAAAFWGSAQNQHYPVEERLRLALVALDYFGAEAEKVQGVREALDTYAVPVVTTGIEIVAVDRIRAVIDGDDQPTDETRGLDPESRHR